MSAVVRMIPSPDWFVGIHNVNLCQDGHWIDEVTFDLYPWDAGTDEAFSFTSPNYANEIPEPIHRITSQHPNSIVNSFYYPKLAKLPRLGYMTISKTAKTAQPSWLAMLLDNSMGLSKLFEMEEKKMAEKGLLDLEMADDSGMPTENETNGEGK